MTLLRRLAVGMDIAPALAELDAHPKLWGANTARTAAPGSPHLESQDIWVRFRAPAAIQGPEDYAAPHQAVWYAPIRDLPSLRPLIFDVMRLVEATYLGGILLTRIPAGGRIYPHVDRGWHAETMDTKCYVILRANSYCFNTCGPERVVMAPGEAWQFDNSVTHSVLNAGETERIALIVTMRTEP